MWYLKKRKDTNEMIYRTEIRVKDIRNQRKMGDKWETGMDTSTLLYIKQITNKDLLCSTGNSTQYSVMT